jgi:hypothetical protein
VSEDNVETLREILDGWDPKQRLEAWKRGQSLDLSVIHPDVTFEDTILPDHVGETYRGFEGMATATEQWLEPFETVTVEFERIVGTGDCLVSIHRFGGKAQYTGIEVEAARLSE